jgi:hypothetical protein
VQGEITGVRSVGPHCVADITLRCVDQRGEQTAHGDATVILQSRERGPVVLPALTREKRH